MRDSTDLRGYSRVVGYSYLGITSALPVTRQVGSLRHSSTLRNFSRVIAFLLLLEVFLQERARRSRLLYL